MRLGVCLWQCGREHVGEGDGVKGVYANLAEMRPTLAKPSPWEVVTGKRTGLVSDGEGAF